MGGTINEIPSVPAVAVIRTGRRNLRRVSSREGRISTGSHTRPCGGRNTHRQIQIRNNASMLCDGDNPNIHEPKVNSVVAIRRFFRPAVRQYQRNKKKPRKPQSTILRKCKAYTYSFSNERRPGKSFAGSRTIGLWSMYLRAATALISHSRSSARTAVSQLEAR